MHLLASDFSINHPLLASQAWALGISEASSESNPDVSSMPCRSSLCGHEQAPPGSLDDKRPVAHVDEWSSAEFFPLLSSHSKESQLRYELKSWDPEHGTATFPSLALTNSHTVAFWLFSFSGLCSFLKTLERILFGSDERSRCVGRRQGW